ncbi:MAG: sensor histidine kinase [Chloroflexota bacterium]
MGTREHLDLNLILLYYSIMQPTQTDLILKIQEDSRKKLARDLHDGSTQTVAALAMRINFVRRLLERDGTVSNEELLQTEELARKATKEIRYLLFTLHPLVLETAGLIPALESMAEKVADTFDQQVIVEGDQEMLAAFDTSQQSVLFYIVEEAVSNARKHAEKDTAWIRVKQPDEKSVLLEIEDHGVGFDPESLDETPSERGRPGIVLMGERAAQLSGKMQIDSEEGSGTCIQIRIPIPETDHDQTPDD